MLEAEERPRVIHICHELERPCLTSPGIKYALEVLAVSVVAREAARIPEDHPSVREGLVVCGAIELDLNRHLPPRRRPRRGAEAALQHTHLLSRRRGGVHCDPDYLVSGGHTRGRDGADRPRTVFEHNSLAVGDHPAAGIQLGRPLVVCLGTTYMLEGLSRSWD